MENKGFSVDQSIKFVKISAMLKIRLQRVGKKHDPSYRIVVTDSRTGPKSNKHVEVVGHYDTIRKTKEFNSDRIKHWISNGALVSDTVHNLLVREKIVEGDIKNVLPQKSPIVDEEAIEAAKETGEKAKTEKEQEPKEAEISQESPETEEKKKEEK